MSFSPLNGDAYIGYAGQLLGAHDMHHGEAQRVATLERNGRQQGRMLEQTDAAPLQVAFGIGDVEMEGVGLLRGRARGLPAHAECQLSVGIVAGGAQVEAQAIGASAVDGYDEVERVAACPSLLVDGQEVAINGQTAAPGQGQCNRCYD